MSLKSVDKALDILLALSTAEGGLSLAEISRNLDLPTSTAQRLVATLAARGFVIRNRSTRKFGLSLTLANIGATALLRPIFVEAGRPVLRELASRTEETAALVWRYGFKALYIDEALCDAVVKANHLHGMTCPLHCSAVGKALLAGFHPADIDRYIRETGLPAYTRYTITNGYSLKEHLETILRQGFALEKQEWEIGAASVAAPINDEDGAVVGAIGITGPVTRLEEKGWDTLALQVSQAAVEASSRVTAPKH